MLGIEGRRHLLGTGHALQPGIMEEDSLGLCSLNDKESRPLLIEAAAFAIHKTGDTLNLRVGCRWSPRQWRGERQRAGGDARDEADVEGDAANVVLIGDRLVNVRPRNWCADETGLTRVIRI